MNDYNSFPTKEKPIKSISNSLRETKKGERDDISAGYVYAFLEAPSSAININPKEVVTNCWHYDDDKNNDSVKGRTFTFRNQNDAKQRFQLKYECENGYTETRLAIAQNKTEKEKIWKREDDIKCDEIPNDREKLQEIKLIPEMNIKYSETMMDRERKKLYDDEIINQDTINTFFEVDDKIMNPLLPRDIGSTNATINVSYLKGNTDNIDEIQENQIIQPNNKNICVSIVRNSKNNQIIAKNCELIEESDKIDCLKTITSKNPTKNPIVKYCDKLTIVVKPKQNSAQSVPTHQENVTEQKEHETYVCKMKTHFNNLTEKSRNITTEGRNLILYCEGVRLTENVDAKNSQTQIDLGKFSTLDNEDIRGYVNDQYPTSILRTTEHLIPSGFRMQLAPLSRQSSTKCNLDQKLEAGNECALNEHLEPTERYLFDGNNNVKNKIKIFQELINSMSKSVKNVKAENGLLKNKIK